MDREKFKKEKKKILLCGIIYSIICEVVSLFVIGYNIGFAMGIVTGLTTVVINFLLMELVINMAITVKLTGPAFLLQIGRLFIFGGVAYLCMKISLVSAVAYAVGIISLPVSALIVYGREGYND